MGDGLCRKVVDPNPGQIQMAAEHLTISIGAAFYCKDIDFCITAHEKYCGNGEVAQCTILSDTTRWFGEWSATLQTQEITGELCDCRRASSQYSSRGWR